MKKMKTLSILLLMTILLTGCGKTEDVADTTDTTDTADTSQTNDEVKKGKEIEIVDTGSSIIQNTDDNIVLDPAEDKVLEESESDIKVDTKFYDQNGDGVIHGKSNETVIIETTLTNKGSEDYTISNTSFITYSKLAYALDATEPLGMDGFTIDSTNVNYDVDYTIEPGKSVTIDVAAPVESEIYNNEKDALTLTFIADTVEGQSIGYRYKYTIAGEESNGEEFEVQKPESTVNKDNIFTIKEESFMENTNGDNSIGNDGDTEYTGAQGRDEFGLNPEIIVTEKSGDGILDLGETAHAKVSVTNDSDKDYTLERLKVGISSIEYYDGEATNVTATNVGDQEFASEYGYVSTTESGFGEEWVLKPGEASVIEFDFSIDPEDRSHVSLLTPDYAMNFINLEFFATSGDTTVVYKSDDGTLNFGEFEDEE